MREAPLFLVFALLVSALFSDGVQPLGSGTQADPYQIATLDNLLWVSTTDSSWAGHFVQTADIDAGDTQTWNDGEGWSPIGRYPVNFTGEYDGQGYSIEELYIYRPQSGLQGMFGHAVNAILLRVNLTELFITGAYNVGGLVGCAQGGGIDDCHVEGVLVGTQGVGGLCGGIYGTLIQHCSNDGTLTGNEQLGGIVGSLSGGIPLSDCSNSGDITGFEQVGGIVGYMDDAFLASCENHGVVSGTNKVGGIAGKGDGGSCYGCINEGGVLGNSFVGGIGGYCGTYLQDCLNECIIEGIDHVGGLAGCAIDIQNGYNNGTICGMYAVGGIAGVLYENLTDCQNHGDVTGNEGVGGLVGYGADLVENSFNTGDISGDYRVGGAVGSFSGSLSKAYNQGSVYGYEQVGGLIGYLNGEGDRILNSFNSGSVIGFNKVGGIAGELYCYSSNTNRFYIINHCYSSGPVDGLDDVGGLAGVASYSVHNVVTACYWDVQASGQSESAVGVGLTSAKMRSRNPYLLSGWDFADESVNGTQDIWGYNPTVHNGYPFLMWEGYSNVPVSSPAGEGSQADPFAIATFDDLLWTSLNTDTWGDWFIQTADIDASWSQVRGVLLGFIPIGSEEIPFTGNYNGMGFIIDSLYVYADTAQYRGLFGYTSGAVIGDVHLQNADVTGQSDIGILAGCVTDYTEVSGCSATGVIHGGDRSGGLIGLAMDSCITGCRFFGNVQGNDNVGGLCGMAQYDATLTNCSACGQVSGGKNVGGLCGHVRHSSACLCSSNVIVNGSRHTGGLVGQSEWSSLVSECCAIGDITGLNYMGGLVGTNYSSSIVEESYCLCSVQGGARIGGLCGYNGSNSIIRHCYCIGTTNGAMDVGGLLGMELDSITSASFWNIETSGQAESAAGIGLTTAQMQDMATYLDAGWDFVGETANGTDDIWDLINDFNDGYPCLAWEYAVDVQEEVEPAPVAVTRLEGNYPNPFNPSTTIHFAVAPGQSAALDIYNVRGQRVCGWGGLAPGEHSITWNGRDDTGRAVAGGVYFYRLSAGDHAQTRKMMLLK